jgi:hypothetical protein
MPSHFLWLPMKALHRTLVDGLLDLVRRCPKRVHNLRMPQGFVEAEDFGTDWLAITAGDALFDFYQGKAPSHLIPSRIQNAYLGGTGITSGNAQAGSLCHHLIAHWYYTSWSAGGPYSSQ